MQCTCAILSFVACPAVKYFFTFCHKRHGLEKEALYIKCFSAFLYNFVWNILQSKKNWAGYDGNVYCPSCKVLLFLSDFNETLISRKIFQNILVWNLMKIRSLGAELFYADRRTDFMRLIVVSAILWTRLIMCGTVPLVLQLPSWSIA